MTMLCSRRETPQVAAINRVLGRSQQSLMKVPLSVAWLSENGMLKQVAEVVFERTDFEMQPTEAGVNFKWGNPKAGFMTETYRWDDQLLLTLSQLLELGFDPGDEALIMTRLLR